MTLSATEDELREAMCPSTGRVRSLGDSRDYLVEVRVIGFPEMQREDFRGNELMGHHRQGLIEGLAHCTLGESNGGLGLWHTEDTPNI